MDTVSREKYYKEWKRDSIDKFSSKDLFGTNGFKDETAYLVYKEYLPLVKPINVLDLGCGNGLLLKFIYEHFTRIVPFGVDWNKSSIKQAKSNVLPIFSDNFFCENIADFAYDVDVKFDTIFFDPSYVLENDIPSVLNLIRASLSDKGVIILHTYRDTLQALNVTSVTELVPLKRSKTKSIETKYSSFANYS